MRVVRASPGFGDYQRQRLTEFKGHYEGLSTPQREDAVSLREALRADRRAHSISRGTSTTRDIRLRMERIVDTIDKSAPLMLRLKNPVFRQLLHHPRDGTGLPAGDHIMVALKAQDQPAPLKARLCASMSWSNWGRLKTALAN